MKTAMILSAGRGERLRPLTDTLPKALCKVKGKPLIEHHVINLVKAGFERLVINHAHLGGQIRHYLGNGSRFGVDICYSPEPPGGLETGGGIVQALDFLGKAPFLTVNADIYTDFDFASLALNDLDTPYIVLTHKNEALGHYGDFGLSADGKLTNSNPEYIHSGISCYHPDFFVRCRPGRYSVVALLRQSVDKHEARGHVHSGSWYDIGTIERLNAVF